MAVWMSTSLNGFDVAVGLRHFSFVERAFIRIGRQEHYRDIHIALDFFSRGNAVHVAFDHDVHQRQVGLVLPWPC